MNGNDAPKPAATDRFRATYRSNPGPRLAIGAIALVVGLGLLGWAVVDFRLWVVLIGGSLMTVGVGLLIDWTRDRLRKEVSLRINGLVGVGLLLLAAALVWASDRWDLAYLAVLAVVAALCALAPLAVAVNAVARRGRRWFVVAGLVVSVGGAALIAIPRTRSMIGVAVLILGLMGYQLGLRFVRDDAFDLGTHPQPDHGRRWARNVSRVAGVVALAPVVYMVASSGLEVSGGRAAVVGVCAYLLLVALLTLGVSWTSIGLSPLDPATVGVFGIVIASIGLGLIAMSDLTVASVLFVIGLVVVAAGSFVVWRGEGIFIVVIVGFLVVWGVVDRTTSHIPDPAAGSTDYIVSLGDSYISGEGAREFFDGTDQDGDENTKNECRRSPTAYSYRVAQQLDMGLGFFACSGAKMVEINSETQDNEPPQLAQLEEFNEQLDDSGRIVAALVSIGGNEAHFGDVAKGCVLPGSCDEQRDVWLQNIETFGDDLVTTYEGIKDALKDEKGEGPELMVVVMPYPLVLVDESCDDSPLEQSEHEFLTEFITVLNEQLRVSAAQAGVHFFEEGIFAFDEHRICESGEAMNIVDLQPSDGGFVDRLSPSNWGHNSMHPTPFGHELTAEVLGPHLQKLLDEGGRNPDPDETVKLEVLGIRTVAPLLVEVDQLAGIPGFPLGADSEEADGLEFGTGVRVRDTDEDGNAQATNVRIAGVQESTSVYCIVGGAWEESLPEGGGACELAEEATGVVTIVGQPPVDESEDTQWVMFTDRDDRLQIRGLRFCSRDARCPDNFDAWQSAQTSEAVRTAAPLVLLLFAGGWLLALWFRPDRYLASLRAGDPLPPTTQRNE